MGSQVLAAKGPLSPGHGVHSSGELFCQVLKLEAMGCHDQGTGLGVSQAWV